MNFTHPFLQKLSSHNLQAKALIYDDKESSYEDLLLKTKEKIELLKTIPHNQILGILGDFDRDCIAFLLACIECKRIVGLFSDENELTSKINEANIGVIFKDNALSYAQNDADNDKAQNKMQNVAQKASNSPNTLTNSLQNLPQNPPTNALLQDLQNKGSSGLILFSSGSTGKPKAILHNLDTLLEFYLDKKPKKMNILLFLLFDHIGGINTLFNTLSMGACGIALKERKNVDILAQNIEKYKIALLPASPSLLNLMLLAKVSLKYDLSSLRLITYGTEKMPDILLEKLKAEFKGVRFHQTFGTSEVGITQTKTHKNYIKLENIDYKIVNNELYLRSKTQSLGYLNASNEAFTEDGYFATGDLVELININGEEYLKIIGRNKELINVGGEKVLPSEIEGVLLEFESIVDCLVFGIANPLTGQSVGVKVVLKEGVNASALELKRQIKAFCKDKLAAYKIPTKVEAVEKLEISTRFKKVRK